MLTTDDLRFFIAIAGAPSLAAAARGLNVSPPAVTQRLRTLEERLAVHLVDRAGRHLKLTDEGELLAERGRDILAELSDLNDALVEATRLAEERLHLAIPLGLHHIGEGPSCDPGGGRRGCCDAVGRFNQTMGDALQAGEECCVKKIVWTI